jgi:mannose/fructose/N-acetylgalactosamine-specific phosphotransferase system component IID
MEQYGIIINDRSGDPLLCEIYPEDQIKEALKQSLDFFNSMEMDVQVVVGPLEQILEILEANGIELTSLHYTEN